MTTKINNLFLKKIAVNFPSLRALKALDMVINGEITLSGVGRELLKRPEIRAAYLEGSRIEQTQGKK